MHGNSADGIVNPQVFEKLNAAPRSPAASLLQLARLKAGLSQRALAERAGVPATMISVYERDNNALYRPRPCRQG